MALTPLDVLQHIRNQNQLIQTLQQAWKAYLPVTPPQDYQIRQWLERGYTLDILVRTLQQTSRKYNILLEAKAEGRPDGKVMTTWDCIRYASVVAKNLIEKERV